MTLVFLLVGLALAPPTDPAPPSLVASPVDAVTVDGVLDEPEWALADVATDFVQLRPAEGAPASQRTEVRILRGPDALYVGATLYDTDPGAIRTTLSRRDQAAGDYFLVALDGYNDRRTAYQFAVTAAGVQFDAVNTGRRDDSSWDAVWGSATRVTAEGWTAEMRIPYSQLRFTGAETAWGLNFVRRVDRLSEQALWSPISSENQNLGFTEFLGTLEGIADLRPQRIRQAQPYSLARARRYESPTPGRATAEYATELGADLKLGLSSTTILDVTVNPDFGQVDADPAELNLSTFETFFSERRPFFLEGTEIFNLGYGAGDGALLYTRRIGGSAPIIGAAKVTGRTAGGLSYGALGAATGDAFDPSRAYAVARLRQDLPHQGAVGGGVTAYRAWGPAGEAASAVGAADGRVRIGADRAWMIEGTAAGTARSVDGAEARLGYAAYLGYDKVKGYFTPGFGLRAYSGTFELNDVGRFRQTDLLSARAGTSYLWNEGQAFGPFQRLQTRLFATQEWRYADGTNRGFGVRGFTNGQLRGFQEVQLSLGASGLGGFDVRETRGLGPVVNVPGVSAGVEVKSDSRRPFRAGAELDLSRTTDGGLQIDPSLDVDWTAADRLTLSLNGSLSFGSNRRSWFANEGLLRTADGLFVGATSAPPDQLPASGRFPLGISPAEADRLLAGVAPYGAVGDGVGVYRPIFGSRDTRSASLTTRANVLFNAHLSLQLYGQLFAARGRFDTFRLLAAPDDLRPFDAYPRRKDFAFSTVNVNAVLRWEYRPGSSLYVVWTQGREAGASENVLFPDDRTPSPFDTSTASQFGDTFSIFPDNVFLVKLSYLLMQ